MYHPLAYFSSLMLYETLVAALNAFFIFVSPYWISNLNPDPANFFYATFILILTHLTMDNVLIFLANFTSKYDSVFAFGSFIVTLYQLYSGFFVTTDAMPKSFAWLRFPNFMYFALRSLMVNEFEGKDVMKIVK
jgi:ABC-type multidrug transport system permease subunit